MRNSRHSLLTERTTANISHEQSFSIPTVKVSLKCFVVYGIPYLCGLIHSSGLGIIEEYDIIIEECNFNRLLL